MVTVGILVMNMTIPCRSTRFSKMIFKLKKKKLPVYSGQSSGAFLQIVNFVPDAIVNFNAERISISLLLNLTLFAAFAKLRIIIDI